MCRDALKEFLVFPRALYSSQGPVEESAAEPPVAADNMKRVAESTGMNILCLFCTVD